MEEFEIEQEENSFVQAPGGKLYGEFDENHRLIVKNQVEAFEEGLPTVDFEQAYDGTLWERGYAPEKPQSVINAERIVELQSLLNKTDWYTVRFAETGVEIPDEIKVERQAAREEISRLRDDNV